MQRFFTLVFLLLTPTLVAATPTKASSVKARAAEGQGVCSAELKPSDDIVQDGWDENWPIPIPYCQVPGWCSADIVPLETNNMMSMQSCADQCTCTMSESCKTFQWKEHASVPGLGTCSIYSQRIGKMGFVPDEAGWGSLGWFWQKECYWPVWGPWPPPPIMTNGWPWGLIPRATEAPAPIAKREDPSERFWALVLAGE